MCYSPLGEIFNKLNVKDVSNKMYKLGLKKVSTRIFIEQKEQILNFVEDSFKAQKHYSI